VTAARAAPPGPWDSCVRASTSGISISFEIALDDDGTVDGERGTSRARSWRPAWPTSETAGSLPWLVNQGKTRLLRRSGGGNTRVKADSESVHACSARRARVRSEQPTPGA